jgi:hypothetical protein
MLWLLRMFPALRSAIVVIAKAVNEVKTSLLFVISSYNDFSAKKLLNVVEYSTIALV